MGKETSRPLQTKKQIAAVCHPTEPHERERRKFPCSEGASRQGLRSCREQLGCGTCCGVSSANRTEGLDVGEDGGKKKKSNHLGTSLARLFFPLFTEILCKEASIRSCRLENFAEKWERSQLGDQSPRCLLFLERRNIPKCPFLIFLKFYCVIFSSAK